ncbi:MAG: hypothetical protein DMG85_15100 [Acidobacteria bacterium]|nr:MAG: hypothetical protein DMG85_15100 [Acidobacteriota bacterium]
MSPDCATRVLQQLLSRSEYAHDLSAQQHLSCFRQLLQARGTSHPEVRWRVPIFADQ